VAPVPRAWRRFKGLFVSDHWQEEPEFRIYAFKSGAWPEMILGAVMGAAGRIEAKRRRERQAGSASETPASPPEPKPRSRFPGFELPGLEESATASPDEGLRAIFQHRPSKREEPPVNDDAFAELPARSGAEKQGKAKKRDREQRRMELSVHERAAHEQGGRSDFRQRFGTYASKAQAELANYRDDEDPGAIDEAANSNTAPGKAAPASDEPADIVVPFPSARSVPLVRSTQALAERLSAALAAIDEQPASGSPMGVEPTRETFDPPVSQATLPAGLAELIPTGHAMNATDAERPRMEPASAPETATTTASLAGEKVAADDGAAFEPPLVLRRMAE
jgi:hypothetical protein